MQATSTWPELAPSPEVRAFCTERNRLEPLRVALGHAKQVFDFTGDPRITLERDPETDDESLVIDITAPMGVNEAVQMMREYTQHWVRAVPPDVIGLIRLIPDIA